MIISKERDKNYNAMQVSKNYLYRIGVGAVIVNKNGLIFSGKRMDNRNNKKYAETVQMPQGGLDEGESIYEGILREIFEETGIESKNLEFVCRTDDWFYYDLPEYFQKKIGGKKGQVHIWFLFNFLGNDNDINIIQKHQEFYSYEWKAAEYILKNGIEFKKDLHKMAFQVFDLL